MKNKIYILGIVLVAAVVFSFTACEDGNDSSSGGGQKTAPTITTSTLLGGRVGTEYFQALEATGDLPIEWSLASGSLPTSLSLWNGYISGTPTRVGTFTFTVKATNSAGNNTKQFSIIIDDGVAPTIITETLSNGMVGTAYRQILEATGDAPIAWSIDSGALPAGLTLATAGVILGTPTRAGAAIFTVKASNAVGNNSKSLSITIPTADGKVPPTIISATVLPNGAVGTEYSQTLVATGDAPITWRHESGPLPLGLSIEETGVISGTPTMAGTSSFSVRATNAAGYQATPLFITITSTAPAISTETLPNGIVGTAYSQTLEATGDMPITWSLDSGTLPAGLSFAANGAISGTPTTVGTSTFTIKASNLRGHDTKSLSITIAVAPVAPIITTGTLSNGTLYIAYRQVLAASGDTPISWSLDSGTLPTGLTLATTGVISGTPTRAGTATFTVKASNTAGSATKQFSITCTGTAPTITTTSLPGGTRGMEYTQTLAATGDPYISWSLDSGALPTGLTLYSSGTIFGTPTTAGTFTFTVKATNDAGNATKQLSIVIAVAPTITTTTLPNGKVGTEYITELSVTGDPTITWSLDSGELPDGLTFYENGYIYGTPTKAGTFTFTVKATNSAGSGTKQLSLTIDGAPIITTTTLPDGVVGTVYEYGYRLTATGGTPIEWSLGNGISPVGWYSLPATGLSLNSSGYIFGTPTTAGTFTFTVQATNTVGSDTKQLSITITGDTPTITTEKLLNWIAGTAYSQTLAAVSTTPVTWSLDSGTLPTGLSLAGTGIITGTPTAAGTFTFTVKATNAEGSDTKSLSIKIAASIEMVQIQDGVFNMGSPPSEPDRDSNESWHFVVISEFKMGKYQVTQGQYDVVMGNNPSYFTTPVSPETSTVNRPVERVSWYDAIIFCNKLSMMKGLNPVYRINGSTDPDDWGDVPTDWYSPRKDAWDAVQMLTSSNGYRLPTEAQWEYACRAGTTTAYNTGDTISDSTGWYLNNSGNRTHSVGEKPSNPWGLYDMHGNVFEWCWDWYGDYPNVSGLRDPTGADSGSLRVYRGGSWGMFKEVLRSAYRNYNPPHYEFNMVGFRVVLPAQ